MNAQQSKLLGIILVVLGAGLVIWGYDMTGSTANELTRALTGSSTDEVMYRYIGGAVCLAAGLFLLVKRS
jgi:hypothetical protein